MTIWSTVCPSLDHCLVSSDDIRKGRCGARHILRTCCLFQGLNILTLSPFDIHFSQTRIRCRAWLSVKTSLKEFTQRVRKEFTVCRDSSCCFECFSCGYLPLSKQAFSTARTWFRPEFQDGRSLQTALDGIEEHKYEQY